MTNDPTFTTPEEFAVWFRERDRMMSAARAIKNHAQADKLEAYILRVWSKHTHLLAQADDLNAGKETALFITCAGKQKPTKRIGKIKDGDGLFGPRWRVTINGIPCKLFIERASPPKYGCPQLWDVMSDDEDFPFLYDNQSLGRAMDVIEVLVNL